MKERQSHEETDTPTGRNQQKYEVRCWGEASISQGERRQEQVLPPSPWKEPALPTP